MANDLDSSTLGERFVRAIVRKDREGLEAVFDPAVDFRGLTPSRAWQAAPPNEVAEIVLGSWFEPGDHVVETLGSRSRRSVTVGARATA